MNSTNNTNAKKPTPHFEAFTPPEHQKKLQLRFPSDELHEQMVYIARKHGRSLNNEIMQAIRMYLKQQKRREEEEE